MGLYAALNASVSGMAAQSNKVSAISQNISNSNTTGYKDVEAQFEDLVSTADENSFNGAGVTTTYSYLNSVQGAFTTTNTNTNLAISGNGFFYVQNSSGQQFLTRDGAFTPDKSGNLVNDAGYTLLGYASPNGVTSSVGGLVPVNVNGQASSIDPTTAGTYTANLPSTSAVVATPPSAGGSTYTEAASLVAYDDLGAPVNLDVYMTKTAANTWELDVYNHADASASTGGFPYGNPAITSQTLNFSGTTGDLTSVTAIPSGTTTTSTAVPIAIPNGSTLNLDISGMTQTAGAFSTTTDTINGSTSSAPTGTVNISSTGAVSTVFANGKTSQIFQIQLASVPDADALIPVTGNIWQETLQAGNITSETPGSGSVGTLESSTLESSTVDLASELTNMISAQSGYEANSKVFQTGTSLLEELVNLIK